MKNNIRSNGRCFLKRVYVLRIGFALGIWPHPTSANVGWRQIGRNDTWRNPVAEITSNPKGEMFAKVGKCFQSRPVFVGYLANLRQRWRGKRGHTHPRNITPTGKYPLSEGDYCEVGLLRCAFCLFGHRQRRRPRNWPGALRNKIAPASMSGRPLMLVNSIRVGLAMGGWPIAYLAIAILVYARRRWQP